MRNSFRTVKGSYVRNPVRLEAGMSLPYCDVHERLLHPQRQTWITWSRMYVEMVQSLCDMLDAEQIACADYRVTQTACDRCTTIARQAVDAHIDPCDHP